MEYTNENRTGVKCSAEKRALNMRKSQQPYDYTKPSPCCLCVRFEQFQSVTSAYVIWIMLSRTYL